MVEGKDDAEVRRLARMIAETCNRQRSPSKGPGLQFPEHPQDLNFRRFRLTLTVIRR